VVFGSYLWDVLRQNILLGHALVLSHPLTSIVRHNPLFENILTQLLTPVA